ncbi:MAG: antibiotic biosynthesis monooxygenase [Acidimicrobiia bacterium]
MAEPFIFINTYRIKPGKEAEYRKGFEEVVDIVRAEEPKMLYFAEHISEDGSETTTVQVHADAENMAHHMQLVGERIQEAMPLLDASSMSIRIYGSAPDPFVAQMRELAGSGVSVTVSPAAVGFNRFPAA